MSLLDQAYADNTPAAGRRGDDSESEFSKGLRGSIASTGAQVRAFTNSGLRAAGVDTSAESQAAIQQNLAEAQQAEQAAANPTWDTVHSLRGGANWLSYKAGQVLPALAGGVGAGIVGEAMGGAKGAIAAPTALFAPLNAGDIALRNPDSSFGSQLAGGALSSLAENALPGALGARFAGGGLAAGAQKAASRTLGQSVLAHSGENILGQAAGMGAGEATKQYAAGQPYDAGAVQDAALGGAVMGVPMAGAHVAGDVLTGMPTKGFNKAKEMAQGAAKTAQDAVSGVKEAAGSPEVAAAAKSGLDGMRKAFTPKEDDGLAKVASGEPLSSENEIIGADGQKVNDQTAFDKVKDSLREMADDVGISPEMRQSVEDTINNLATSPSAVRMGAAMASGWKATKDKATKVKDFATKAMDDFNERTAKRVEPDAYPDGGAESVNAQHQAEADAAGGVKHSDDFSGERKVITDTIAPWLQKNSPETLKDPEAMKALGETFRQILHHTYTSDKPLPEGIKNDLFKTFGEDATKLLDQMHAAKSDVPQAEQAKHFGQMSRLAPDQKAFGSLTSMVQKALDENGHGTSMDAGELARHMLDWAIKDPRNRQGAGTDEFLNAKSTNDARQVQDMMDSTFGSHSKKIMKALESEVKRQQGVHEETARASGREVLDEGEHMYDEGEGDNNSSDPQMDRIQYGSGRSKDQPVYDPVKFKEEKLQGQNYGQQALMDAQKVHADRRVAWKSEKELGTGQGRDDHGFVVAEKLADSDGFQGADYKRMAFNTKAYGGDKAHPSRIDLEGHTLDATKIERAGAKHMQRSGIAPEGDALARKNQALLHGIAQLQIEHPGFKPSPDLVVRHVGGNPVKLSDIKSSDTVGSRSSDKTEAQETLQGIETHELHGMSRRNHNDIKAAEDQLRSHIKDLIDQQVQDYGPMSPKEKREEAYSLSKNKDLRERFGLNELEAQGKTLNTELFKRERSEAAQDVLAKNGQTDVNPDANIHQIESLAGQGADGQHRITANVDGTPRYTQTRSTGGGGEKARGQQGKEAVVDRGHELAAGTFAKTGLQRKTGNTLGHAMLQLSEHMDSMTPRERASLVAMTHSEASTEVIAKTLSPLKDKYLGADWKAPELANTAKGDVPKQSNMKGTPIQGPSNHELGAKADAPWEKVFGKDFGRGEAKPAEAKPAEAKPAEAKPTGDLAKKLTDAHKLLDNPPDGATTEQFQRAKDWGAKQEQRLTEAMKKVEEGSDEYDRLDDMRFKARMLKEKADSILKSDADAAEADQRNGTNLFGGNPDPKALAAEKAASSGKSLERMRQEFPDLKLRKPTAEEQARITAAHDQVMSGLGDRAPDVQGISIRSGEQSDFAGKAVTRDGEHHILLSKELFDDHTPFLGSVDDKVERALAHEVAHLVDRDDGNFSDNTTTFNDGGRIFNELKALTDASPEAHNWFGYAFDAKRPQRELFAQALAAYHLTPETLHDNAPKTYKFLQDYLGQRDAGRLSEDGRATGADVEGGKKETFLREAKSGNPEVLSELKTSDNPKALQRAVEALAGEKPTPEVMKATDAANDRIAELLHDNPDAAYGMQLGKKYSLEGTNDNSHGFMRRIAASAERLRQRFAEEGFNGEAGSHASEGASFGNTKDGVTAYGKTSDGTSYVYVIDRGMVDAVSREMDKLTKSAAHSDEFLGVLETHAIQYAYYDHADKMFGSISPEKGTPAFAYHDARGDLEATKHTWDGESSPVYRVKDVTRQQLADLYGGLSAFHKLVNGGEGGDINWVRDSGANPGKTGGASFSLEGTAHERGSRSAVEAVKDYLDRVTPWVRQELNAFMKHAGEFDPRGVQDVIRVAVNALNPRSTAFHESMHAFVSDLMKKGHPEVVDVLQKVADSPMITSQLKHYFKDEIGVLRQLKNDPEERIAVMYQMWAQGKLNIAPKAEGIFGRIAQFLKGLVGHWTNEEHAEHIMNYFHSGEYAEDRMTPSAVSRALMSKNLPQLAAQIRTLAKPVTHLAEEVVAAGGQSLRDTNVPSLQRIAELVKKKYTDEGKDAGYLPASREAYTERANKLAGLVEGAHESVQREALDALQTGKKPQSADAQTLYKGIRDLLDEAHGYLTAAGVKVEDLGVGKDYFPRTWDPHYLSKNKDAFMDMARNYPEWFNPEETYNKLVAADGSELQVVGQPGMGAKKERVLSFIKHEDAAPFMTKELLPIVSSYLQQATRKAEWARRFGGDNSHMTALLSQARAEGATTRQIKQTEKYMQAVNGTLGDDLNPTARRLMGDMIVYQNIRLLPLAFFSGIVDPMGIAVRGGGIGNAWKAFTRGISEIPAGLKGTGSKDAATKLAEDLDVISKASLVHALGATYTQGVVGGTARKINDTFFRFNMMEQWNTSMRVSATEAALQFIGKHAAGEGTHSARYMKELGLSASDVKMVEGRVATNVQDGLSLDQAARIKSAVNQWVDGAMLRPDAADKAVWMSDPHYMLISHLKQFVYAFHHTILGRVMHEAKNGNYSPAMALMGYVPIMIAADATKGFLQTGGGVPSWKKDWGLGDYIENGVERAGLFGVGQIGLDAARGNFGSLTGPSIEQLADAAKTLAGRETFRSFALHSMPANALYANAFGDGKADPTFAD